MIVEAVRYVLHLDVHLADGVARFGTWVYAILFAIIFSETGFVVTPFLPGDSLLFVAGAIAAIGGMDAPILVVVLTLAATLGNTSNYWIGRWIGPRVFHWEQSRWFNRAALLKTHSYFERYGAATVTLARFMPFVRTFAPFVAGVGSMNHLRFQLWNVLGGVIWVAGFVVSGYFFGNMPIVQKNLAGIMLAVVVVSLIPLAAGALRAWWQGRHAC